MGGDGDCDIIFYLTYQRVVPIRSVLSSADEPFLACSQEFLLRTDLLTFSLHTILGIAV